MVISKIAQHFGIFPIERTSDFINAQNWPTCNFQVSLLEISLLYDSNYTDRLAIVIPIIRPYKYALDVFVD